MIDYLAAYVMGYFVLLAIVVWSEGIEDIYGTISAVVLCLVWPIALFIVVVDVLRSKIKGEKI